MRMAMDSYPKMFRIFVAKQVPGWCGSNNKRSLWDSNIANICPNCGMTNETSKHMTQCKDPGRITLLHELITEVITCLEEAHIDPDLVTIIETYLLGQASITMESCLSISTQKYLTLLRLTTVLDGIA